MSRDKKRGWEWPSFRQETERLEPTQALAARICWYSYKEGQTQDVIAGHLKITRKRVNQILGEARESGIVQITIASPTGPCSELEARLLAKFRLRSAIVIPSPVGDMDVRNLVGAAAGRYISEHLPQAGTLGITWGGTINMAASRASYAVPAKAAGSCCCVAASPRARPSTPMTTRR